MASYVKKLADKGLISPPNHVTSGIQYETIMGSNAYGVSSDMSDTDIYGFSIPDKEVIFPHLSGIIQGFDKEYEIFNQYQQHHIKDESNNREYDICIYNIVKYFSLCMDNNPNMIDSLYTPDRCVVYSTEVGKHVRENRDLFLHKGSWHKFKGYAYSQLHKIKSKSPEKDGKRYAIVEKYGYDVKYAYHVVRLINEVEQILNEHTIDLERDREQLKAIRKGEIELEQIIEYFNTKEKSLEIAYQNSTLRHKPDKKVIKTLLLDCLEMHYGTLSFIPQKQDISSLVNDIQSILDKHK